MQQTQRHRQNAGPTATRSTAHRKQEAIRTEVNWQHATCLTCWERPGMLACRYIADDDDDD